MVHIVVNVDDANAVRKFRELGLAANESAGRVSSAWDRIGYGAQRVGRVMTGIGAGILGIGYYGAKSAINFQTAMTRIQTQAGASKAQVDALSAAVLQLGGSGAVQFGPTQLAKALYHIESVAVGSYPALRNTSTAMVALRTAAQGAAVGGSDLEQTTTALMGVLFATRAPASQFGNIMGLINATVGAGNMTMSDLVQALGRGTIPAFRQVGLTATDALAAIALFADSGIKASSASAQVATALHYLVAPSAKADKYLRAIGMSQIQMAVDLRSPHGMITALQDLKNHLANLPGGAGGVEAGQVLAALFPGGRGRIMLTLLQNLDRYGQKIQAIYDQQGNFSQAVKAQAATMGGKLHAAWAVIQTDMVKFGDTILPIIAKYLPKFITLIQGVLGYITRLPAPVKDFVAQLGLALVVFGPVLWGLGKLATAYAALRGALAAIKAAGIAAGFGEDAAAAGVTVLTAALRKLAPLMAIYLALKEGPKVVKAIQKGKPGSSIIPGALLGGGIMAAGAALAPETFGLSIPAAFLLGAFGGGLGSAGAAYLNNRFKYTRAGSQVVGHHSGGVVQPRHFLTGGSVFGDNLDNVPAFLQVGEGVLNHVGMAGIGGPTGLHALNSGVGMGNITVQPTPVNLFLDGRMIARNLTQQVQRKAARGPTSLSGGSLAIGARLTTS